MRKLGMFIGNVIGAVLMGGFLLIAIGFIAKLAILLFALFMEVSKIGWNLL